MREPRVNRATVPGTRAGSRVRSGASHGHARRRRGRAARRPQPAPPLAASDQSVGRSDPEALRLAIDRSGQHGRPHRRHRRRRKRSAHHLSSDSRRAASGRRPTTARPGRRSSTPTRCRRSATSRSRRRIPTSSTSARARQTTARARRSARGVYKSIDGGKTFQDVGPRKRPRASRASSCTRRIRTSPTSPRSGHLFGPNKERGLYKTTDGGKTWTNTKFIDEDTGFTDVVMDPANPNILYRRIVSAAPRRRGASTAAARAAACGRRPTAGRRGRS